MYNIRKRLLGAFGLLLVAAMTLIAAALPTISAYAADQVIKVVVENNEFSATISSPAYDNNVVVKNGRLVGSYTANAGRVVVTMVDPEGTETEIYTSTNPSGHFDVPFTLTDGYGEYEFFIESIDAEGQHDGDWTSINYHSANFVVKNPTVNSDPEATVNFGPEVCGVSFQFYLENDPTGTPLLNPPYSILDPDFRNLPGYSTGTVRVTIPLSKAPYYLQADDYIIDITTYDCSGTNAALESDIDADTGIYEYRPVPIPDVPPTGMVKIGGILVAEKDLVLTTTIAFILVVASYFFIRTRRYKKKA